MGTRKDASEDPDSKERNNVEEDFKIENEELELDFERVQGMKYSTEEFDILSDVQAMVSNDMEMSTSYVDATALGALHLCSF